jgi:hypothetical protein
MQSLGSLHSPPTGCCGVVVEQPFGQSQNVPPLRSGSQLPPAH